MIKGGVGYYRNQNIYGKQKNEEAHLLGINRAILNYTKPGRTMPESLEATSHQSQINKMDCLIIFIIFN